MMYKKDAILFLVVMVISVLIVLAEVVLDSRSGEINVLGTRTVEALGIILLHLIVVSALIVTIRRAQNQKIPHLLVAVYAFSIILCSLALIAIGKVVYSSFDHYRHLVESFMLGIFFLIPLVFELKRRRSDSLRKSSDKNE